MRRLATDFLTLCQRDELLLVAVANRLRPTEAGDLIATALDEIEAVLALPEAERDAALAAAQREAVRRLAPFRIILAQIDPARRGYFTALASGSARFEPTSSATARATPCRRDEGSFRRRETMPPRPPTKPKITPPRKFVGLRSCAVSTCHACRRGVGEHCVTCKRVGQDEIRAARAPHNVRPDLTADRAAPSDAGRDPPTATPLPPPVEDALRRLFATLADLPPVGLLHLVHRATRRTEPFAEFLSAFVGEMRTFKPDVSGHVLSRAMLKNAWLALAERTPAFAVLRSWKAGHGGATANREAKRDIDVQQPTDAETADHSRDRDVPFADDRDESATNYWFNDGDGREL